MFEIIIAAIWFGFSALLYTAPNDECQKRLEYSTKIAHADINKAVGEYKECVDARIHKK